MRLTTLNEEKDVDILDLIAHAVKQEPYWTGMFRIEKENPYILTITAMYLADTPVKVKLVEIGTPKTGDLPPTNIEMHTNNKGINSDFSFSGRRMASPIVQSDNHTMLPIQHPDTIPQILETINDTLTTYWMKNKGKRRRKRRGQW
jgi:hypothetical protein